MARSISRARVRTERGTQSSERSSSMMAPLMRAIAYVSNLISRSGVEPLDGADQAEEAVRDEVLLVDVPGKAGAEPSRDELDERRVREDQPVAERRGRSYAGTPATARACCPPWTRRENTPPTARFPLFGEPVSPFPGLCAPGRALHSA